MVLFVAQFQIVQANFSLVFFLPYITINSDGSVDPETEYIYHKGNVYTLTGNMTRKYALIINCSDIVFDGAGYVIDGTYEYGAGYVNVGLTLNQVSNVTIKDISIIGFSSPKNTEIKNSTECSFTGVDTSFYLLGGGFHVFSDCMGYFKCLSSKNNTICTSTITGMSGWDVSVFGNNIYGLFNEGVFAGSFVDVVWDNGSVGNYWSAYKSKYPNASEIGTTGIGDTPYVIDEKNIDHYPLMYPVGTPEINVTYTKNATCTDSFPLNFVVDKPIKWASYSLDGAGNVTVFGNTTLSGMPAGVHNVTIFVMDVYGFEAASNTVIFTTTLETAPFPFVPIVVAVSILAIIAVSCIVFWKKKP